jgi:ABC-type transport system involved in multi-copper enzyme maturation permease subunit
VGIYVSERIEDFQFMVQDAGNQIFKVNPAYFFQYFTNDFLLFMMVMIIVLCGAGLISDDLKYNSLQLYFSRPLKKKHYFIGKASVIVFFLFIITLIPGIVFFLFKLLFSGSFEFFATYPWLLLSIFIYSIFVTAFFAFYTLLFSSLSKNRRYVAIQIWVIYIFSDIFFGIFYEIFRSPYFSLISIKFNLKQVGAALFKQNPIYNVPWILSLIVLLLICGVSAFILKKKIKGVQVIK